jgi:hypothetical protein
MAKKAAANQGQARRRTKQPNILIIWGDDIGWFNVSAYNHGIMGYRTPNIDRVAQEGCLYTDWYGQQSCTAGRAAFMTGQSPIRTGLTKVGLPGSDLGLRSEDPTIAELLKPWAMSPDSSVRTTWATAMNSCPRPTAPPPWASAGRSIPPDASH